ncbi:MAG: response regulator [Verrucomicrobia bacterium]|nr:response regulator [Verrucomicrobiota bacterium]
MSPRPKLLLLDDQPDDLTMYRKLLSRLPSQPEIYTATTGARALRLLESEPFSLLISDLRMPKMDGLQVLTIVKRRFAHLRTAVLTSVVDEQFRTRAYAIGVDLFLEKPATSQEIAFLLDCIEGLLDREEGGGFRGVQSKNLVDIIQLECLSRSSSTLRIVQGLAEGRIWIRDGDIIDAETGDLAAETAFRRILSWKSGNFEVLPADEARARTIQGSYQGLLLETAHALDEAQAREDPVADRAELPPEARGVRSPLGEIARMDGVEFVLAATAKDKQECKVWGVENPEQMVSWMRETLHRFRALGESLEAGQLNRIDSLGFEREMVLAERGGDALCVGFHKTLERETLRRNMKTILATWAS